ncbi:MAG: ribonuclease H-like domain-containing protein, partial [Candidatus Promineifilaceae bacterium]
MANEVVFDIETSNSFADVGKYDASLLKVSLVGLYSYAEDRYLHFMEDELPKLWRYLESADRVIGYNLYGFDYKVLNTYYPGDLSQLPTLDLMAVIADNLGRRIKLDDVAHGSLGIGKSGNGLQAIEYFRRGEIDKLRDYCLQDVRVTKDVYEFGRENGFVKFKDRIGGEVKVEVDFKLPGRRP